MWFYKIKINKIKIIKAYEFRNLFFKKVFFTCLFHYWEFEDWRNQKLSLENLILYLIILAWHSGHEIHSTTHFSDNYVDINKSVQDRLWSIHFHYSEMKINSACFRNDGQLSCCSNKNTMIQVNIHTYNPNPIYWYSK